MNAPQDMGNLPISCILVSAPGVCGIANQRPGWSCDAKGKSLEGCLYPPRAE